MKKLLSLASLVFGLAGSALGATWGTNGGVGTFSGGTVATQTTFNSSVTVNSDAYISGSLQVSTFTVGGSTAVSQYNAQNSSGNVVSFGIGGVNAATAPWANTGAFYTNIASMSFFTNGDPNNAVMTVSTNSVNVVNGKVFIGASNGAANKFAITDNAEGTNYTNLNRTVHITRTYSPTDGNVGALIYGEITNSRVGGAPGTGHLLGFVARGYDVAGSSFPIYPIEGRLDVLGAASEYAGVLALPIMTSSGYSGVLSGLKSDVRMTTDGTTANSSTGTTVGVYVPAMTGGLNHYGLYLVSDPAIFGSTVVYQGYEVNTSSAITIPDNAVGSSAATFTWSPMGSTTGRTLTYFACSDADGCNITMGEGNAVNGARFEIINNGANTINFSDSSGVSELTGALALGTLDNFELTYDTDRFVQTKGLVNN